MQQRVERRKTERQRYRVLRAHAKMLSYESYTGLVAGVFVAGVLFAYVEEVFVVRFGFAFLTLLASAAYFRFARAHAQVIYILFDIAHNTRVNREALERMRPEAPAEPQKG
ncbi:MAG: hypothetical protein ACE5IP_08860 [Terriglobia bacterium]